MSARLAALAVVARAVLPRPALWATGVRVLLGSAPAGWWKRPPFVPVPAPDYVAFRMATHYGDAAAVPQVHDVVRYLRWCRELR